MASDLKSLYEKYKKFQNGGIYDEQAADLVESFTNPLNIPPYSLERPEEPDTPSETKNDIVERDNAPKEDKAPKKDTPDFSGITQLPTEDLSEPKTAKERYLQLLERSQKAGEEARERDRKVNMLKGFLESGAMIGKGIAGAAGGGEFKMSEKPYENEDTLKRVQDYYKEQLGQYQDLMGLESAEAREEAAAQYRRDRLNLSERSLQQRADEAKLARDYREGEAERRKITSDQSRRNQVLQASNQLLKVDPRYQDTMKQAAAFEKVGKLITQVEQGNQTAIPALGTQLARAMGEVGVLTDKDVVRYLQGTEWFDKLQSWWLSGAEGTLPENITNQLKANADIFKENALSNIDRIYGNAAGRLQNTFTEYSPEELAGMLGKPTFEFQKEEPSKNKAIIQKATEKGKIVVRMPDGQMGAIDKDKIDKFKEKFPKAQILEE